MVGIGVPTLGRPPRKKKPEEEGVGTIPTAPAAPALPAGAQPVAPPPPGTGNLGQNPPTGALPIGGGAVNPNDAPSQQGPPANAVIDVETGNNVTTATDPEDRASEYEEPPRDIDALVEEFIRKQLTGEANTAEEEALIRELMGQQMGKDAVGNRASMGRAGFASSGALGAMQADSERAARQQALDDILGLRRDASQQAIENALAGGGLDIGMRDAATREREARAKELALQNLLAEQGILPPAEEEGGGINIDVGATQGANAVGNAVLPIVTGDAGGGGSNAGATTDPFETATTGAGGMTAEDAAGALDEAPAGYTGGRTVQYEGDYYRQYTGPDGSAVWVRE